MRYYFIRYEHEHHPHLRWIHFPHWRPWYDRAVGEVSFTAQLVGPGAQAYRLKVINAAGDTLTVTPQAGEIPPERNTFPAQNPANKQLWSGRVVLPRPEAFRLVDADAGKLIAGFVPEIIYPEFLFALAQSLQEEADIPMPTTLVETGTLFAHTTLHASYWFRNVITIELSQELADQARAHLAHRPGVRVLQGNSSDRLKDVIAELEESTLFFLDAHWSGDSSVDWDGALFRGYPVDTARIDDSELSDSERQVPLRSELEMIAQDHKAAAAVLIDDWEGIGRADYAFKGEDWRNLDREALVAWIAHHPRTRAHRAIDPKRYLWLLGPTSKA